MNNIPNRQVICDVLIDRAYTDQDIVVVCSDSRGSASFTSFADVYPSRFIEVGISEQNLVSIAAGVAKTGKKVFAASPACFLSTRSLEQARVDVAYSDTNVKLIGVSGGISYGSLGMTHHSNQDIATMGSIPNMRVYLPSDRHQTRHLINALIDDEKPAYVRVGRNAVEDIYTEENTPFTMDKATVLTQGDDIAIIACGEMVTPALRAAEALRGEGIFSTVMDMYCVKPIDQEAVMEAANHATALITIEEHSGYGGLGAQVCQIISRHCPKQVINLSLPDTPVIAGKSQEVFDHYSLNTAGIVKAARELMRNVK